MLKNLTDLLIINFLNHLIKKIMY